MTVNVTSISQSEFDIRLKNLMKQLEKQVSTPYQDTATPITHPTIGIGFDLTVEKVRKRINKTPILKINEN
jgi:hypothetical protein